MNQGVSTTTRTAPTMALLAACMLIFSVDYNIVYVALPEIGAEVGFSPQSLQWVVSAYAVGLGGFLLLGGRAVDRLGARRMLVVSLVLYAVASLAGGIAPSPGVLIGARVVQGIGGALLFPATLALISISFAAGLQRNKAFAWWGTAGASGAIAGAMLGGVLTSFFGWESVFFVNVPLCGLAILGSWKYLSKDAVGPAGSARFDVPGALAGTGSSLLLVFGLISGPEAGWDAPRVYLSLMGGVLLLAAFFVLERISPEPLAPPLLLSLRSLVVAAGILFVFQGAINSLHYLFFLDTQSVLGYSPLRAGLAFLPMSLCAMIAANKLLPFVLGRFGLRSVLLGGMLGIGAAMILLAATMTITGSYWSLLPALILWGASAGMLYPAMFLAAGSGVAPNEQGVASALGQTSAQIGGALGLAALIAVANLGLDLGSDAANPVSDVLDGLKRSSLIGGMAAIAGAFLALLLPSTPTAAADEGRVADGNSVPGAQDRQDRDAGVTC